MKALVTAVVTATLLGSAGVAVANADLAKKKNCLACHTEDKKLIGPAYKDVAAKYANDANAEKLLADHIRKGSSGIWGPVPMPANPQVNEEEAATLAKWVLSLKK